MYGYALVTFIMIDFLIASGLMSVIVNSPFMPHDENRINEILFWFGLLAAVAAYWPVPEIFIKFWGMVNAEAGERWTEFRLEMERIKHSTSIPELPPDPGRPIINVPMRDEKNNITHGLRFHNANWKDWVKVCRAVVRADYQFKSGTFVGLIGGRRFHDTFRPLWLKYGILQMKGDKEVELTKDGIDMVRRISKLPHDLTELPIFLDSTVADPTHTQHTQGGEVV